MKKPISVRLQKRIHKALEEYVIARGTTTTIVVEEAITEYLGIDTSSDTLAARVAALEEWRDSLGKLQRVA
jgi:predicted transcriptional regulator